MAMNGGILRRDHTLDIVRVGIFKTSGTITVTSEPGILAVESFTLLTSGHVCIEIVTKYLKLV